MNKQVFLGDGWDDVNGLIARFQINAEEVKGCKFIVAEYAFGDYEGSAYVLFKRDGKLWEVTAGHCSCYGLDGQWSPQETSKEALKHILNNGSYFGCYGDERLAQVIREYVTPKPRKKKTDQQ